MELDLSILENLKTGKTYEDKADELSTAAGHKPELQLSEDLEEKIRQAEEARAEADAEKAKAAAVYREYQQKKKTAIALKADILKAFNSRISSEQETDSDIYSLFLKAVKTISLLESNEGYYRQIYNNLDEFKQRSLRNAQNAL